MITRFAANGLTWIDLENPTADETLHISEEFGIPSLVSHELIDHTVRSKVDLYNDFLYLVLHFPIIGTNVPVATEHEVNFIIGENFLVTVRYEKIEALHSFAKLFENNALANQTSMTSHRTFLFMQLTKLLYHNCFHQLEGLTKDLKKIESTIFATKHPSSVVRELSKISHQLLDFKQSVRFHGEVLSSYLSASKRLFGDEYTYYGEMVGNEYRKVGSMLESLRDVLAELQRTNDTLLSTTSNEIMKNFTIMTFVMLPLTLITGVFGMNMAPGILFIKSMSDFFFVIGAMTITGLVLFLFFKIRRWI